MRDQSSNRVPYFSNMSMESDTYGSPFAHLLGQQRAKDLLCRVLVSGRIAHAYLFRGPDGVGKRRFAHAMAKALNCRVAGPAAWCGHCPSCKKFESGNHPDYHVESPEKGAIKIDRIREVSKLLAYAPYESMRRVVVIEDVHTMRSEAANSLLKTLEEPPEGNVLILTAEMAKGVLNTITSRCQIVPFFSLSDEDTARVLVKEGLMQDEALLLARLAEGSPGRGLTLKKMEMVGLWRKTVTVLTDPQNRKEAHCAILLQLAGEIAELKEHISVFLSLLRLWLHDRSLKEQLSHREQERIWAKLDAIDMAEKELARNCNRALVCEILLFRLQ